MDLDHSFDFEEDQEAGGAIIEKLNIQAPIEENKDQIKQASKEVTQTEPSLPKVQVREDDMEDLFKPSLFGSTPQYADEELIEAGQVDLSQTEKPRISNVNLSRPMQIIDMAKTPTSDLNITRTIASEQKRMLLTQNLSQDPQTPASNTPIIGIQKRPSTTAKMHQKRSSIESFSGTHSKDQSLRFNKEETDSLKEIFSVFDKKDTGYVKEEDLLRMLDVMNKDNQQVSIHSQLQFYTVPL